MSRTHLAVVSIAMALASACSKAGDDKAGTPKPQPVVGASIVTVQAQRFTETVDAVGSVLPRLGHVASLAAPVPARVSKVFVAQGARVTRGDALVQFDQSPFEAAARSSEAALSTAQKAAERTQRLAEAGVSPRREADVAASELALAQANALNARRARDLSTLRAPIGGVVTRISAVLGASADPSQSLVEVADPTVLDVVLTLSPADAARVHVGQAATLFAGAAASGAPVANGKVADVSAAVDTLSRGVTVRVGVAPGSRTLRIGETVFGRIAVGDHADALVIPDEALVPTGEGFKVFVVAAGGIAQSRAVKLGGRSDRGAWVTEGLTAGERIVTKGAYGVDDSVKVSEPSGRKP